MWRSCIATKNKLDMISKRLVNHHWFHYAIFFLLIMLSHVALPQSLEDISSINVDDLSDQQLEQLVNRASEAGFTEAELLQMAQLRGLPSSEVDKLKERLEGLVLMGSYDGKNSSESPSRSPRRQLIWISCLQKSNPILGWIFFTTKQED